MPLDPYFQLGVEPGADRDAIEQAWLRLRGRLHPDRNPDDPYAATKFALAKEAYEILSDSARRSRHDRGEETAPMSREEAEATAELASAMAFVVATLVLIDTNDIILLIADTLRGRLEENDEVQARISYAVAKLERTVKRLRRRGRNKRNVLGDVMAAQLAGMREQWAKCERTRAALRGACAMLDDYEDTGDIKRLARSPLIHAGIWR